MKIEKITLLHVRIPLVEPFRISNGVVAEKDGIVVAIHSEGLTGYGEASPMAGSFYSDETPESTWRDLTEVIIPAICEKVFASIAEVNDILDHTHTGSHARAGIETACWDLICQQRGIPLFRCLGGERDTVESGLAVGIYSRVPELLTAIEHNMAEGYKRVKIKIQPGWDVEPLAAVREHFGDLPLMVDANCAYTRDDIPHLQSLDEFHLMMIEQPLPREDLPGHAQLQNNLQTPVCLDESAFDVPTVVKAIELRSCRIVNIKIQRVGGLQHALEIHDLCAANGIPVWAGTMPELGIGGAQAVHLATLSNFTFPTDVQSSHRWFHEDIIEPYLEVVDGLIRLPSGPGNGYRLRHSALARYRVHEESF